MVPKGFTFYTYLNIRVAKWVEIIYITMYVCMYVCMYTMILPLHFSVPIYSPWQQQKNSHKIKRGAGPHFNSDRQILRYSVLLGIHEKI